MLLVHVLVHVVRLIGEQLFVGTPYRDQAERLALPIHHGGVRQPPATHPRADAPRGDARACDGFGKMGEAGGEGTAGKGQ